MRLHTASEAVSFAKKLENESAELYQDLSRRYAKDKDIFISFAKENEKNVVQIERAYYGVITDAIEGCFDFDIETDEYTFEAVLAPDASYSDALNKASSIEEKILRFYSDVAQQSDTLMADVPRTFRLVAKKRDSRRPKLMSLLH